MHSDQFLNPLGNPKSCTEEYIGRSPCFRDMKSINALRACESSSPITAGPLCFTSAATVSGTRRSITSIDHFDQAHPHSALNHPFSRFMNSPPSLNDDRPPHLSALRVHASRAPANPRCRAGVFHPQNVWLQCSASEVSRFPTLVTLSTTNCVCVFHRRALLKFWRSPILHPTPLLLTKCAPSKEISSNSKALSLLSPQAALMEDNQGQPSKQGSNRDPLGTLFNSKECNIAWHIP